MVQGRGEEGGCESGEARLSRMGLQASRIRCIPNKRS